MSFADRVVRALEKLDRDLWEAHEQGSHEDGADLDCALCRREAREVLNPWGEDERKGN